MAEQDFRTTATRGFAWNYLYKISEYGLINLYTILVVRHFGPDISAPYSVFFALGTILTMVGAFAVDGVLLRYIHRVKENPAGERERFDSIETLSLPHFLNTLLAFRLLVITVISVGCLIVFSVVPSFGLYRSFAPYLVIFLFAQAVTAFSSFALTGLLELKSVFFASIVSRLVMITAGIAFVASGAMTTEYAIAVFSVSTAISGVLLYWALHREVKRRQAANTHPNQLSLGRMLSIIWSLVRTPRNIRALLMTPVLLYGITMWGNDILSLILGKQTDIMMMAAIVGEHSAEIGYYQAASIVLVVTEYIFLFGFGGTLVSVFSTLAHQDEQSNDRKSYRLLTAARNEVAGFQNVVLLPLCLFIFFFIKPVSLVVFGDKFLPSIPMVKAGLGALFVSVGVFGGGMQITTLISIGKERLVFRIRLFWGILNFVTNIALIYYFGALGAIVGTQYCNAGAVATEWFFATKYVGNSMNYLSSARLALISLLGAAIPYLLIGSFADTMPMLLQAICGGILDALIVVGLYRLLHIPELGIIRKRFGNLLGANK